MGLFSMTMATAIVVLQVTLILSNREPNLWVFSLLQHKKPTDIWTNFSQNFHSGQNISGPHQATPFAHCIEQEWDTLPEHCRLWYHTTQEISSIFNSGTWNPHLIILVLASIHLVICFSASQEHHYASEHEKSHDDLDMSIKTVHEAISTRIYHFPLGLSLLFLALLSLIVGLIASNRHNDLHIMDAPTIVISLLLFFSASLFLYIQHYYFFEDSQIADDEEKFDNKVRRSNSYPLWVLIFQLQIIGVPLTVLMISVMGVRFYTDIVSHFLLLSAAVNSLWLQRHLQSVVSNDMILVIVRFLTCGIPLFCFFQVQAQWGNQNNTWGQITVFMAFLSIAPLFVFTLFPLYTSQMLHEDDPIIKKHYRKWNQIQLRLGNFCTSAALGSTVINLALL